ncbi:DUF5998 family protein [Arachnia propionica]|uniref:DUF5998 family protein n=1 Tax=Arachnia propionica TaxID=1750 RepID=UPI001C8C9035|nr:DUF5998 family protein [Arachnia propionica]
MISQSPETPLAAALKGEVEECRFFPELVWSTVAGALGDQQMLGYLVHHEASFATGDLQRHLTVLVLTPKQLLISHTDEQDAGDPNRAITSAEVVALRAIHSAVVTRSVAQPERWPRPGSQLVEAWLTIAWGAASRLDIGPASCEDPQCSADHGWTGMSVPNDLTVRMSPTGDGWQSVERLMAFGALLQENIG